VNKQKIADHFGTPFLGKLTAILDKYISLWQLSDLEQVDYYSVNCIFTCTSEKYGDCVLKVSPKPQNLTSEYNALVEFGGGVACRAYEFSDTDGVLLLERIKPGTQLRDEPNFDTRLGAFCQVFKSLHTSPNLTAKYATYIDWVSQSAAYMRTRNDYAKLSEKMSKAEEICRYLWQKHPEQTLLHGDLHHDNILLGENGYRVIDPKGAIGNPVFDIPRFMLNEENHDEMGNFARIASTLSEKFNVPEEDIRLLYFIEICMGNCWSVEYSNRQPDWNDLLFAERVIADITHPPHPISLP